MGRAPIRLPDERLICARCHQTAVYDHDQARALFERVISVVTRQLGLHLNVGADFTLADAMHMRRLAETSAHPPGDPSRLIGLFVRKGMARVMYALSGLPQILLIQTVAHEWAHAWQGENCPLLQDPLVTEGFAEWVAYKTLEAMGATKTMAQMTRQNGPYGEGLRKMIALERDTGVPGVLAFCQRSE